MKRTRQEIVDELLGCHMAKARCRFLSDTEPNAHVPVMIHEDWEVMLPVSEQPNNKWSLDDLLCERLEALRVELEKVDDVP